MIFLFRFKLVHSELTGNIWLIPSDNKWEFILHSDKTGANCSHFVLVFLNLKMSYYLQGFQFSCSKQVLLPHQREEGALLHCLGLGTAQRLSAASAHCLNAGKNMACTGTAQQAPSSASVFKTDILFRKNIQAQTLSVIPSIPSIHPGIENCCGNGKWHIKPNVSQNCQSKLSLLCWSTWFCIWHNFLQFGLSGVMLPMLIILVKVHMQLFSPVFSLFYKAVLDCFTIKVRKHIQLSSGVNVYHLQAWKFHSSFPRTLLKLNKVNITINPTRLVSHSSSFILKSDF